MDSLIFDKIKVKVIFPQSGTCGLQCNDEKNLLVESDLRSKLLSASVDELSIGVGAPAELQQLYSVGSVILTLWFHCSCPSI